jgi:hypothetical protein
MWTRTALLIAFFSFLNEARAQFMTPGMMQGQACPYPYQMAPQILPPGIDAEEDRRRLRLDREDARRDAHDIEGKMRALRNKIYAARAPISSRLLPGASDILFRHMENRGDGEGIERCGDGPVRVARVRRVTPSCENQSILTATPECRAQMQAVCASIVAPTRVVVAPAAAAPAAIAPEGNQGPPAANPPVSMPSTNGAKPALTPTNNDQGSIVPAYCSRMPASDATGIVKPAETTAAPAQANPADDTTTTAQSGGTVEEPPPLVLPPAGAQVFCPGDLWANRYRDGHGRVHGEICTDNLGPQHGGNPDACLAALDRLDDLYEQLAEMRRERDEYLGDADSGRITEGNRGARRLPRETQQQRFMGQLQNMFSRYQAQRAGMPGYPYAPGSSFANMNYGAGGNNGMAGLYNGLYGFAPGGIPNGGGCNQGLNQNMFGNPFLNAMQPPWMTNGVGPWGPGGPQIRPVPQFRPVPGQGIGGLGGMQIRPVPYAGMGGLPGMPGVGGLVPGGPPRVLPIAGGGVGGAIPPQYAGIGGMGSVFPGAGGFAPSVAPMFGGTLAGQQAMMSNWAGNWGGGAVPNYFGAGVGGGYSGPGYTYQPNYFNFPSLLGSGAPKTAPIVPF